MDFVKKNSLVVGLAVGSVFGVAVAMIIGKKKSSSKETSSYNPECYYGGTASTSELTFPEGVASRAIMEVDLGAISHNVSKLQALAEHSGCKQSLACCPYILFTIHSSVMHFLAFSSQVSSWALSRQTPMGMALSRFPTC